MDLAMTESSHQTAIDWSSLYSLQQALGVRSGSAILEILRIYHENLCEQVPLLEQALHENHIANLRRLAHRMRGASRQVGAHLLANACEALERTDGNDHELLKSNLANLIYAVNLTIESLEQPPHDLVG